MVLDSSHQTACFYLSSSLFSVDWIRKRYKNIFPLRLTATMHATTSLLYYYSCARDNSCPLPPATATSTEPPSVRTSSLSL
jgi:hypothetical protein